MSTTIPNRARTLLTVASLIAVLAVALGLLTSTGSASEAQPATTEEDSDVLSRLGNRRTISVDVAQDHTRTFADATPRFDDGLPSAGTGFMTSGYLYPAGTLSADDDGVNEDGSPSYPKKVVGEWLCRGYLIGDGAHATEGSWVYSTQVFSFGKNPTAGRNTVVVVGYEGIEAGATVTSAITGGTGRFQAAAGDADQMMLGFTTFEGNDAAMPMKKRVHLELTNRFGY